MYRVFGVVDFQLLAKFFQKSGTIIWSVARKPVLLHPLLREKVIGRLAQLV